MKDSLQPGISLVKDIVTTPEMAVRHMGENGKRVFSTPAMVDIIEYACVDCASPHLDENEQSVGTVLHIWHKSAVRTGDAIRCEVHLKERDRRRLLFEVKVTCGERLVGDGTHERFVIDMDRFTP
ncbi:MAG: thioesterase [Deltaproteobacteria bacterium]|nr:thioesterase [Deltaproteobacteria bacterium]